MKLCCTAIDQTERPSDSLRVQWYKNQQLIPYGKSYNQTFSDLRIKNIIKSDGGIYQCKAVNKAGIDMSQEIEITVKATTEKVCDQAKIFKIKSKKILMK